MSELDSFRSQWLRELKLDAAPRKLVGPVSGVRTDECNVVQRAVAGCAYDGVAHIIKGAVKRRCVELESNTLCQEQPRAFDIADRLLQGEILTNDDLFGKCEETKKRALDGHTKPVECSEVAIAPAPVEGVSSSLVDTLISDLVMSVVTHFCQCDSYTSVSSTRVDVPSYAKLTLYDDIFKHIWTL